MRCPHCGAKMKKNEQFCPVCGKDPGAPAALGDSVIPGVTYSPVQKKSKLPLILGAVVVLAALAGVAFFGTQQGWFPWSKHEVPSLVGMDRASAEEVIRSDSFFELGEVLEKADEAIPEGQVIDQSPVAGTKADRGTTVDLFVSTGPAPEEEGDEATPEPSEEPTPAAVDLTTMTDEEIAEYLTGHWVGTLQPLDGDNVCYGAKDKPLEIEITNADVHMSSIEATYSVLVHDHEIPQNSENSDAGDGFYTTSSVVSSMDAEGSAWKFVANVDGSMLTGYKGDEWDRVVITVAIDASGEMTASVQLKPNGSRYRATEVFVMVKDGAATTGGE